MFRSSKPEGREKSAPKSNESMLKLPMVEPGVCAELLLADMLATPALLLSLLRLTLRSLREGSLFSEELLLPLASGVALADAMLPEWPP